MSSEVATSHTARELVFERLEYGKLCETSDGPIVKGSECYPLATSRRFPSELRDLCRPWLIGIGEQVDPRLSHGTVIRALRGRRSHQIACRLRRRPEDKEGGTARRFWRGRYLAVTETVDPWSAFQALEAEPLSGITVLQSERPWDPLTARWEPRPPVRGELRAFLAEAAIFCLSGIAIGLEGLEDEASFFHRATSLWSLLPTGLKRAFATGWGVEPALAPKFNLALAASYPPSVAVYDLKSETWRQPRVTLATGHDVATAEFEPRSLIPGRMYAREVLPWSSDGGLAADDAIEEPGFLAGQSFGLDGAPSRVEILAFDSAVMFQAFQEPGIRCLDQIRLRELKRWLKGEGVDEKALCRSADHYFFRENRFEVLSLGLRAMVADPRQSRVMGTEIVWRSLRDGTAIDLDHPEVVAGIRARLRLLQELAARANGSNATERGDVILDLYAESLAAGDLTELPQEADDVWRRLFLQGVVAVDQRQARIHRRLLKGVSDEALELRQPYRSWVQDNACLLALAVAPGKDDVEELSALRRLVEVSGDPFVSMVLGWRQGNAPDLPAQKSVLDTAVVEARQGFSELLAALWRKPDVTGDGPHRREQLLPWIQFAGVAPGDDPLLLIAASDDVPVLSTDQLTLLAKSVRGNEVPESLVARVAAVLLASWSLVYEELENEVTEGPCAIFRQWPAELRVCLGIRAAVTTQKPLSRLVEGVAARLNFEPFFLERCLKRLVLPQRIDPQAAKLLWRWCRESAPSSEPHYATRVDLCRGLATGGFPETKEPREEILDDTAALARAVGVFPRFNDALRRLWPQAIEGWQVRLLLDCARKADLDPEIEQLEVLVAPRHRRWLKAHLRQSGLSVRRKERFAVATLDFQQGDFLRSRKRWRPGLSRSVLWAAFANVPPEKQGDLRKALRVYAADVGLEPNSESMANLASVYLNSQGEDTRDAAAERVLRSFVLPLASEAGTSSGEMLKIIDWVANGSRNPASRWPKWLTRDRRFGVHQHPDRLLSPEKDQTRVAIWFHDLLLQIIQTVGVSIVRMIVAGDAG